MTATMLLVVLVAIIAPLILYVREGWRDRSPAPVEAGDAGTTITATDEVEFFAAGRGLTVSQYATTTVAYGLQMAAVVLFAQWGYYYGYAAFLVPTAWCVGFLLLALSAKKLDTFLQSPQTLHRFLGDRHGRGRSLVKVAALATLLGLGGALFAELGYATTLVQHLLGREESFRYVLMFFFLGSVLLYVLPGGFRAVVDTDSRQLPAAYIGLAVLLAAIIYASTGLGANSVPATIIGILSFATIAVMAVRGILAAEVRAKTGRLVSVIVPLVSLVLIGSAYVLGTTSPPIVSAAVQREIWAPQPMSLLTALSLVMANALWQFVDLSAFQRLTALRLPSDANGRTAGLRRAILWTALESPISWCIGIAIGIGLGQLGVFGGADGAWTAYDQFLSSLARGDGVGTAFSEAARAAVVGFSLVGLIAIMLSSVDSLGSAVAFTTTSDLLGSPERPGATKRRARVITVIVLLVIWGLLAIWQAFLSSDYTVSAWLYTAYAMQLSLLGVCICALLNVRLHPVVALLSVCVGVLTSAVMGVVLVAREDPNVFVVPPILAVSTSFVIVLVPLARGLMGRKAGEGS